MELNKILNFFKVPSNCYWLVVLSTYSYFLITGWEATLGLTLMVCIYLLLILGYIFILSFIGYLFVCLADGYWHNIIEFYKTLLKF